MDRYLRPLAAVVFVALLYVGARAVGAVPPLGPFLDPDNGVWAVAAQARLPGHTRATLPALGDSVRVLYDVRGVPHIFAATTADAVRALGYVVARDRLFQLELQTRAAAGTLTELVGPAALDADEQARNLGLAWSAERAWAASDSAQRVLSEAFAQGVNAYRDQLTPGEIPIEYRLLHAKPFHWKPVYSLYLQRRMGYTLAYGSFELRRQRVVELVGERAADALFPIHAPIAEPIVPGGRSYPVFDTTPLPPPEGGAGRPRADLGRLGPPGVGLGLGEGLGSNNWAVGPSRSATGHALLEGDPHLDLSLPSIWYEVHLVAPGLDVYGVTIPGSPGVVIGFNRDVAWSFTNTQTDVIDYYRETVDEPLHPTRYRLDGAWRPLERRIETYRDREGDVIALDTIYHTHRGPIVWRGEVPYSIRWTLLESRGDWAPFAAAQYAHSADEWIEAMRSFDVPSQNGLVADRRGTIAEQSAGWYPVRPGNGRGDVVRDGSTSASDWVARVPQVEWPRVMNPAQGYIATANQEPVDPRRNPDYFGADWYSPWRAMRINQLLRGNSSVTVDDMRRFQTDPRTVREQLFRPAFLDAVRRARAAGDTDLILQRAVSLLAEWDGRYTPDNRRAVLFEMAMDELESHTWDELVDSALGRRVATPEEAVLYRVLHDPRSPWWDVRASDAVEDRDEILNASLRAAFEQAELHHGDPDGDGWRWDHVQTANIYHLLRIPAFSALGIAVQGGPGALTPVSGSGTHGPSWRMVVELGDSVRAWVTYPGGQSGNPVSPWYEDRIAQWAHGELSPAIFPHSVAELERRPVAARLTLVPGGR